MVVTILKFRGGLLQKEILWQKRARANNSFNRSGNELALISLSPLPSKHIFLVLTVVGLAISACKAEHQSGFDARRQSISQAAPAAEELPIPRGPFKHSFQIETKYDKFKDLTKVSLDCKVYNKGPFALFFAVEGSYPQQSPSPPETIQFGLTAMSMEEKYKKSRRLIILADGRRFDLGELNRDVDVEEEVLIFEKMVRPIPFRTALQIANSQSVEMQLNEIEFKVSSEALEALRDFTSRFRKE